MQIPNFEFTIQVGEKKYKDDLKNELLVGDNDINVHLDETPSRLLYWSSLKANAAKALKEFQDTHKIWLATEKNLVANQRTKDGKRGLTSETSKEDAVIISNGTQYMLQQKGIRDAEYNLSILQGIVNAWGAKKELLVTLGANYRSEMESGLRIQEWNKKVKNGTVDK